METNFSDENEIGEDFLSNNLLLPMICTYIEPEDVIQCRKVCRNFCNTIDKHWSHVKKIPLNLHLEQFNLFVSDKYDQNKIIETDGLRMLMKTPDWCEQSVEIQTSKIIIKGSRMHPFWKRFCVKNGGKFLVIKIKKAVIPEEIACVRTASMESGVEMIFSELLPQFQLVSLQMSHFEESIFHAWILDSFVNFYSSPNRNIMMNMDGVTEKRVRLIEHIGCSHLDFFTNTDSSALLLLDTSTMITKIVAEEQDTAIINSILKEWQAGIRNFRSLSVRHFATGKHLMEGLEISEKSSDEPENIDFLRRTKDDHQIRIERFQDKTVLTTL